jgi:hypothetical protein
MSSRHAWLASFIFKVNNDKMFRGAAPSESNLIDPTMDGTTRIVQVARTAMSMTLSMSKIWKEKYGDAKTPEYRRLKNIRIRKRKRT